MLREVMSLYARSFRESDWLVRSNLLYLLVVPVLVGGMLLYLVTR